MKKDNYKKYLQFRDNYSEFIYESYNYWIKESTIDIEFHFIIPGLAEFKPSWTISKKDLSYNKPDAVFDNLIFSLGLVELISYWKTTCSPRVHIKCGKLSEDQIVWWKKLYRKGLGEFFYLNGITVDNDFMELYTASNLVKDKGLKKERPIFGEEKVLVPIGGGKDSITTLELVADDQARFPYIINPRGATIDTVNVAKLGEDKLIIANRTLDKNMLELNKLGFLNGHTPFSALVAFSSIIAAYVNDIGFIALSNESSANESTVLETDINHQYSKSYEFEMDFINYEERYITSNVKYFSLLRPLTELKIAQLFARYKEYHGIFRSCNVGSKSNIWCGQCSKCLFVYIILSPFLDQDYMINIFGKDLFDDKNMKEIFEKLVGILPEKPFECVGSRGEINAALQEILRQYKSENQSLPYLLEYYKESYEGDKYDIDYYLTHLDKNNSIPKEFYDILISKIL